ncbi:hypothetical protein ACWD6I_27965, partial [Streptomyces sp. NPDC002454]
ARRGGKRTGDQQQPDRLDDRDPGCGGLVWRRDRESWQLTTLAGLLAEEFARTTRGERVTA